MHVAQVVQAVRSQRQVVFAPEFARSHGVVEDEARAADQVPVPRVVDRAVILEIVEEPTSRIDAVWVIEGHGLGDVFAQHFDGTEIR